MNKKTYEQLVPVWDEWSGYGGWDHYSMMVTDDFKMRGGDFQQYLLEGQTIVEWTNGKVGHELIKPYKEMLCFNQVPNHGEIFKQNIFSYVTKRINKFWEFTK
jgi:hypothetical protein